MSQPVLREAVCPDGRLLLEHLQGVDGVFERLVRSWAGPVYAYLSRAGVRPAERDDLFQDVFTKVHRFAANFDPSRPFKPWLFAIVVNATRDHIRELREREKSEVGSPPPLKLVAHSQGEAGPSAQSRLEAEETARFLEEQLAELPESQREVVLLCCVEHWPQADVAQALGLPVNTVKTQLRRARLTMAKALARRRRRIDREVSP